MNPAFALHRESLELSRDLGDQHGIAESLRAVAEVTARSADTLPNPNLRPPPRRARLHPLRAPGPRLERIPS